VLKKIGISTFLSTLLIILLAQNVTLLKSGPKSKQPVNHEQPENTTLPKFVDNRVYVAVYYYAWFGNENGSQGSRHWDNTLDTPVIGCYSSYNETVIEWQISLMYEAGIDLVLLSWWGPRSFEDGAIKKFLEVNQKYDDPLDFAIVVEPFEGDRLAIAEGRVPTGEAHFDYESVYKHVQENFVEPHYDTYFEYEGKPLLVFFNPAQPPETHLFNVHVAGDCDPMEPWEDWVWMLCEGGETSDGTSVYPPWFDDETQRARNRYCSVLPRFDDWGLHTSGFRPSWRRFDVNYSEGLYDRQWEFALAQAAEGNLDIIGIFGWNEYQERIQIEPHHDASGAEPYKIYNETKENIQRLRVINSIKLSDFQAAFASKPVRVIYPSDSLSKPLNLSVAIVNDWLASVFLCTKLSSMEKGLDTDGIFVDQSSGRPLGESGTSIISFGGPEINSVVRYAESESTPRADRAPIQFLCADGVCLFRRWDGECILGAGLPVSTVNQDQDMFVIETYRDGAGRRMLLFYGFGRHGTYAAGMYFEHVIYPDLTSYSYSWVVVKWEDTDQDGFVDAPGQGDTYTLVASGC